MALTDAAARPQHPPIHRRAVAALAAFILATVALTAMTALFLWPDSSARYLDVGHIDHFPPGSVSSFRIDDGRLVRAAPPLQRVPATYGVHIVRLEDGELLALSWRSTHLGPAVHWEPEADGWVLEGLIGQGAGVFSDPRSGAIWAMDGMRVFGPAPRDLDRFAVEITDAGRVRIDVSRVIEGARPVRAGDPNATPTPALIVPVR